MNKDASKENKLTLQKLLNLNEESSQKILGSSILISVGKAHNRLEEFLVIILSKTFEKVDTSPADNFTYDCELFINEMDRHSDSKFVHLGLNDNKILISSLKLTSPLPDNLHPFIYYLVACYAGPVVLKAILEERLQEKSDEISLDYKTLIKNEEILNEKFTVSNIYLAGAGAIGNSFLYALSTFNLEGVINICDPDIVSGGNLNRCLFFDDSDIGRYKVDVLVEKSQLLNLKLNLVPFRFELGKVPNKTEGGWLNKLVVAVDSRRTRRKLQTEIPFEVFDASTTGISEVVIFHSKANQGRACLGCIYKKERQEEAHEIHIADSLGVTLDHVRQHFITKDSANLIALKYQINADDLIGVPYDTLFKQLCGEGVLMSEENLQVLAPLSFVSALAGGLLALRFIEEHFNIGDYNYWRVSPWNAMNFRLKQFRSKDPDCEICSKGPYKRISNRIWNLFP